MGTDRTVRQTAYAFLNECFHALILSHLIGRKNHGRGFANLQTFSKPATALLAAPRRALCVTISVMSQPPAPKIQMSNLPEYREGYANSVQIRVNLWDFFLLFGLVNQTAPDNVNIQNFQGIYLSPQQAKALLNVIQQNITQYETAFGEIKLEPHPPAGTVQ